MSQEMVAPFSGLLAYVFGRRFDLVAVHLGRGAAALLSVAIFLGTGAPTVAAQSSHALTVDGNERASKHQAEQSIGYGNSLAFHGDDLLVGEAGSALERGLVYIYRKNDDGAWVEADRIDAPGGGLGTQFGASLDVDGDRLIVGAPEQGTGTAYVYQHDGDEWQLLSTLTPDNAEGAGRAVALAGDVAVLGSHLQGGGAGAAYIFRRQASDGWRQEAEFFGEAASYDWFGRTVGATADFVFVGAPLREFGGAVYVYERSETSGAWEQRHRLKNGALSPSNLGHSLDVRQDLACMGDTNDDHSRGSVVCYRYNAGSGSWTLEQKLVPDAGINQWFGYAVSLGSDRLLISAPLSNTERGLVYVYEYADGSWGREAVIGSDIAASQDFFGTRVALGDGVLASMSPTHSTSVPAINIFRETEGASGWHLEETLRSERQGPEPITGSRIACEDGTASIFPCMQVDLLAYLPIHAVGGPGVLNDVWGWTDPDTGREYAVVGRSDGAAFIDVTDPVNPVVLGKLPTNAGTSGTRDVKVLGNFALVVADIAGDHGMQVFDMTKLRTVTDPPVSFTADALFMDFGRAHNLAVNEETEFAYAVGSDECGGGLLMIDMHDPLNPVSPGCYAADGYVHDAQCVIYRGPDPDYQDREICINSSKDDLAVVDVSDKRAPRTISAVTYPNLGYVHQGWLSIDHRHFYLDDEGDEFRFDLNTRTLIWDMEDLDDPQLLSEYVAETADTDHNQYVVGDYIFQANYGAGLHILEIRDRANPREVGYLDTVPGVGRGAWSVYPFFESGTVVVSSIQEGVFIVKPTGSIQVAAEREIPDADFTLSSIHPNPFRDEGAFTVTVPRTQHVTVTAYDLLGRLVETLHEGTLPGRSPQSFIWKANGLPSGLYTISVATVSGTRTNRAVVVR